MYVVHVVYMVAGSIEMSRMQNSVIVKDRLQRLELPLPYSWAWRCRKTQHLKGELTAFGEHWKVKRWKRNEHLSALIGQLSRLRISPGLDEAEVSGVFEVFEVSMSIRLCHVPFVPCVAFVPFVPLVP